MHEPKDRDLGSNTRCHGYVNLTLLHIPPGVEKERGEISLEKQFAESFILKHSKSKSESPRAPEIFRIFHSCLKDKCIFACGWWLKRDVYKGHMNIYLVLFGLDSFRSRTELWLLLANFVVLKCGQVTELQTWLADNVLKSTKNVNS